MLDYVRVINFRIITIIIINYSVNEKSKQPKIWTFDEVSGFS